MLTTIQSALWNQFAASMDMLKNPPRTFAPRLPFTFMPEDKIPEDALDDIIPNRFYTRTELLDYLEACREKCRRAITGFTEDNIGGRWIEEDKYGGRNFVFLELLMFNMRHVQHHTAQLNTMLREAGVTPPQWVRRAADDLENSPK